MFWKYNRINESVYNTQRTDINGITKQALKYKPNGRRKTRHQRKDGKTNFTLGLRNRHYVSPTS